MYKKKERKQMKNPQHTFILNNFAYLHIATNVIWFISQMFGHQVSTRGFHDELTVETNQG